MLLRHKAYLHILRYDSLNFNRTDFLPASLLVRAPLPLNLYASTLTMEAEYSFETLVSTYMNTRQQDPETTILAIIAVNTYVNQKYTVIFRVEVRRKGFFGNLQYYMLNPDHNLYIFFIHFLK